MNAWIDIPTWVTALGVTLITCIKIGLSKGHK